MVFTIHLHIVPRLKKEYSYTSTPSLGLYSLSVGEVYLLPSVKNMLVNKLKHCLVWHIVMYSYVHVTHELISLPFVLRIVAFQVELCMH